MSFSSAFYLIWEASLSKELLKVAGDEGGNSIAIKKVKALT